MWNSDGSGFMLPAPRTEILKTFCTPSIMSHPSKLDRAAIVAAGMELLARDGLRGLSLRAIAAALEVAPNALYHHVTDRKGLERMLAAEVSVLIHAALPRKIGSSPKSSEDAIRTLAAEYMRFAREHRLLYEALLKPRPAGGTDATGPEQLWLFVLDCVTQVSGKAVAHESTVALWAFLHGMASLQSVNAFDDEKPFGKCPSASDQREPTMTDKELLQPMEAVAASQRSGNVKLIFYGA